MQADVLIGLQWGDEGKGKIVDVLAEKYDIIARFQGGPNAGHTLEFDNIKHVLHTIPSGVFHKNITNLIGNGVVIDPVIFQREIDALKALDIDLRDRLLISKKAHLILPSHRILDAASEAAKGSSKIGSTLKGIAPAYMDKTGRNGLRVGDILDPEFHNKYKALLNKHKQILCQYDYEFDISDYEDGWMEGIELIKSFQLVDSEPWINRALDKGQSVLAEGAQGTLLDIDFGTYPFVTSSNTICAGACTGLGIAPKRIGEVIGVFKAYCTRVGSGPFPTELFDENGEQLQKQGHEYGATTGRPRRCGWLDLMALKYAVMINGVTQLFMTKADVLDAFETLKTAVAYNVNNRELQHFPYEVNEQTAPVYKDLKGWQTPISGITSEQEMPGQLREYIQFIEQETGTPVKFISVGPKRKQTVVR